LSLGIFDLAVVLLGTTLGKLADRYNQKRLIFFGLLIFAVAGSLLGFALNIWFLVLGFIATAGHETSGVSLWAWLERLDKRHDKDGLVNGAIVLFEDLGWTIGPIVAGLLFVPIGASWTIAFCATPIIIVWLISAFSMHDFPPSSASVFTPMDRPRQPRHKG
ncbi:MAG: MFS transporter, partial [Candidatus Uhrbacteria bacterium]|nr:MFS transporter [Candidatus Uhrbacteria bacterium]